MKYGKYQNQGYIGKYKHNKDAISGGCQNHQTQVLYGSL